MVNAILRLRRDNDYNYAKIKDTFVPANGEICLVDTAREGLRAVCGDGISTFGELQFLGDFIQKGYLKDGRFYEDALHTTPIEEYTTKLYIDLKTSRLYYFDGEEFKELGRDMQIASEQLAGVMKLYSTTGDNEDGTMTQRAITKELSEKFELTIDADDELIIFEQDII
jgi:hypothetical protein